MFKKLINFASNIIKPAPISKASHPTLEEENAHGIQSHSEYQPQLTDAISPASASEPAISLHDSPTGARDAGSHSNPTLLNPSNHNAQVSKTLNLGTLYRSMPLQQGMLYLAEAISSLNKTTYIQRTEQWFQESNFQTLGADAITAKRQGDHAKAIAVFNDLAQGCPYYYQIHHSMMKILGASGDLDAALQAAQLWCVAIIPEKALRLDFLDVQLKTMSDLSLSEQLSLLAGWAIADTKSMYHLGSLHMMGSDELSIDIKNAYIASLQGRKQQTLHQPKIAIQRGKEVAQNLPWDVLIPVMQTELWQYLSWRSQQQAQTLEQRRRAA